MLGCRCSVRALEYFVQDLAGINLRLQQTLYLRQSRKPFCTRPSLKHLKNSVSSRIDDERNTSSTYTISNGSTTSERYPADTGLTKRLAEDEGASQTHQGAISQGVRVSVETFSTERNQPAGAASYIEMGSVDSIALPELRNDEPSAAHDRNAPVPGLPPRAPDTSAATIAPLTPLNRAMSRLARRERRERAGTYRIAATRKASREHDRAQSDNKEESHKSRQSAAEIDGTASAEDAGISTEKQAGERKAKQSENAKGKRLNDVEVKKADSTNAKSAKSAGEKPTRPVEKRKPSEAWQVQKEALERKFGEAGWQPRKRLSPDTLEGIRALHASDSEAYSTEVLADHFKITPEAIRRILRSKWKPSEAEAEDRRARWERRGARKWQAMSEQGMRAPAKWRAMGIGGQTGLKEERLPKRKKDRGGSQLSWNEVIEDIDPLQESSQGTLADRFL